MEARTGAAGPGEPGGPALATVGPLPLGAGLGDGPGGLLRRRRRLVVLPLRARRLAGLPLERGRHGGHLRRPADRSAWRLSLWNGADRILKERPYGLTGTQGNHGEDVKDYWWYLDATPTSSWLQWRYHYPQRAVPVRGPARDQPAPDPAASRSTSWSTRASSIEDRYWVGDRHLGQGRPRGPGVAHRGAQRRPRGGHHRRAADHLVPQPLELGSPEPSTPTLSLSGDRPRSPINDAELVGSWVLAGARRPRRRCSATTTPTSAKLYGVDGPPLYPRTASPTTS